ncbi:phosphatidate cytidylyltransferase [Hartmannibacter diazotrophicus]|uniref:phosphatidate cytidylyltransferase n=1 Tax=Hartmannibacter diazotrophicus TaxID=1482074 RepID=UPI001FE6AE00|nr:phosphatidate cytidylyltransferase [Hartmannibacter diazotrophicus]
MPSVPASNLVQRVLASLVLVPVAVGITYVGGIAFLTLLALLSALVMAEWLGISKPPISNYLRRALPVFCAICVAGLALEPPAAVAGLGLGAAIFAATAATEPRNIWIAAGLVYAGLPAMALAMLRGSGFDGFLAVIFVFVVVWATDSGAYFAGRSLGGPKLAPRISPKKTWSGAIGGALAAILSALAFAYLADLPALPILGLIALGLSVVAQLGDLAESAVKRYFGVKDSGSIIPGHGGVMDRLDGVVPAAVVAAAICIAHGGDGELASRLLRW